MSTIGREEMWQRREQELQAENKRLKDAVTETVPELGRLRKELKELREKYEAMRLEWSKAVDERDAALARGQEH